MKFKILFCVLMLILGMGIVSSVNLDEMNFNIPLEFEKVDDAVGLQFIDESKDVHIRIFDDEMDKWDDGFEKYNETVLVSDDVIPLGDEKTYYLAYGEYIKIDGKEYWVEVSNDNLAERNADNCLEALDYFNTHNTFESVEV